MTDNVPTPTANESTIVLLAIRLERRWITRGGKHGVVVHGRTLSALQDSAQQALALRLNVPTAPLVQVLPQSAELDELATARLRYAAALRDAVQALRADGTSWADTARACGVRVSGAQAALRQDADQLVEDGSPVRADH
ncbi:hypothetical protein ABZ470_39695 [Streptosporangium sp. NPDC020072]|uniref:hypothetical protein n=1 Tax=Streptosporangium sp. NPDC020072 TaxID=3154788 RepID=UPI00342489D1